MKFNSIINGRFFRPAAGAALVALLGLAIWMMPATESWTFASYDCLFRFVSSPNPGSNQPVLIRMDNGSYDRLGLTRPHWNRKYHAQLVKKLADDGAKLVVFDVHFDELRSPEEDVPLADAMRRCPRVVLMAGLVKSSRPNASNPGHEATDPDPPVELFRLAAQGNWGIGEAQRDGDGVVRRHWPFPAPVSDRIESLAWVAARLSGARLPVEPREQWLRYYSRDGAWNALSYHSALEQESNYFAGKVVFIGNEPATPEVDEPDDEFRTPYTSWDEGRGVGGMEILATTYLNLMNEDWLERFPGWLEIAIFISTGILLGGGVMLLRWRLAIPLVIAAAVIAAVAAICLMSKTRYWFPWLILVGGQVPCALAIGAFHWRSRAHLLAYPTPTVRIEPAVDLQLGSMREPSSSLPETPGYELVQPHFGAGAYGKVWLARNVAGQWQALKAVYLAKFENNAEPYDREFRGITRFKPISKRHPGLLEVDYISPKKPEGYFYYVMELGDATAPGWELSPTSYRPNDLSNLRAQSPNGRLAVSECVRIGISLADTLEFLHGQELTHRDIKPSNIIFVNDQPKFADVGLVTDAHPDHPHSIVGTVGYMPPAPERAGTPAADLHALGMVLFVISTGQSPQLFPTLSTSLIAEPGDGDFLRLNRVILKACNPDLSVRYTSAGELKAALLEIKSAIENRGAFQPPFESTSPRGT